MPKLRLTYDKRLINKTSDEWCKAFLRYNYLGTMYNANLQTLFQMMSQIVICDIIWNSVCKLAYNIPKCLQCFHAVGWVAGRASGM